MEKGLKKRNRRQQKYSKMGGRQSKGLKKTKI